MALTEDERKFLAELEETFATEDPKLATKLSTQPVMRRVHPTKAIIGVLGLILGLLALVVGISVHWAVSVAGFIVMLCSVVLVLSAWVPPSQEASEPSAKNPTTSSTKTQAKDFMSRIEERWQNRQQG